MTDNSKLSSDQASEDRTDLNDRIARAEGKLRQLEKEHASKADHLHSEINALKAKVERLETMAASQSPLVEEHDARLDEHDRQLEVFTRAMGQVQYSLKNVESNVGRLADEQTSNGLATLGLLRRMCKKLGVPTDGLGPDATLDEDA